MQKHVDNKVSSGTQILLRRIAPNDHAIALYEKPGQFINDLVTFVRDGFKAGETIVVVATSQHLLTIQNEMRAEGFDIFYMTLRGQFITFDVETVLDKFMVNDWPDEVLFKHVVLNLAAKALKNEKNVRVFSEMAAVLYMKGYRAASVQLERIWAKVLKSDTLYSNVKVISEVIPHGSSDGNDNTLSFLS
jgi:hypothetical protein